MRSPYILVLIVCFVDKLLKASIYVISINAVLNFNMILIRLDGRLLFFLFERKDINERKTLPVHAFLCSKENRASLYNGIYEFHILIFCLKGVPK